MPVNQESAKFCGMSTQIVIPARLASTRLPEKLLLTAAGKSVLQHTHDAAARSVTAKTSASDIPIIVAVDDPRLAAEVDRFGGHARMTSPECNSGTDRVAEIARIETGTEIFVNVQGDEPEIDPAAIDLVAQALFRDPLADMATIVTPIRSPKLLEDPACVKAVVDETSRALYFSRAGIPFSRDGVGSAMLDSDPPICFQHLGLYAYRREFLAWFASTPPSSLEQTERLEQLRAIQAGKRIVVAVVDQATPGIDTLEDFRSFAARVS